jgi:hypothetical protein
MPSSRAKIARRLRRSGEKDASVCGMVSSLMRLAEDGGEGQDEDFVAAVVGDVHDPVAPIFRTGRHDVGAGETLGVLAGLDQAADGGAALIDQHVFFVGAVEEDVAHVPHPFAKRISQGKNYQSGIRRKIRAIPGDSNDLNQTGVMMRGDETELRFALSYQ